MANKFTVNLLGPELLPERKLLTLTNVAVLWVVVLIIMLSTSFLTGIQANKLENENRKIITENRDAKNQVAQLEKEIQNRRVDSRLQARLDVLKTAMANRSALHQQLTDTSKAHVAGFSTAMTELADNHHKEISLERVVIKNDEMTFAGLARKPEAVPAWLAGFQNTKLLSGKAFVNFKLEENANKVTTFVVSSSFSGGNADE